MKENPILEKSFAFSLRIIRLYKYLVEEKKEYILSKELLIAGTNIGKHVKEAVGAESRQTFISEIALRGVKHRKPNTGCNCCCTLTCWERMNSIRSKPTGKC